MSTNAMPRDLRNVIEGLDVVHEILSGLGPDDWANHRGQLAEAAARAVGIASDLGDTAAALVASEGQSVTEQDRPATVRATQTTSTGPAVPGT